MLDNEKEISDLGKILDESWRMIERGVKYHKDPFHYPVLGTAGNIACNLRTVILRQFDKKERILVCHTDKRAEKTRELSKNSQICWLFYHPKKQVQLRIWGRGELHSDDSFADEKWKETRLTSRLNYCSDLPPGTPVDRPLSGIPDLLLNKTLTLINTKIGRKNFASISCKIYSMDWLKLSTIGNSRAKFSWENNKLHAEWIIP